MRLLNRLPLWSKLLLKALLVMLIPLQFEITGLLDLLDLPFDGLLFTPWISEYYYFLPEMQAQDTIIATVGKNFLIGVALASPAILFNYRLSKSPANKPSRKLTAAAIVLSSLMVLLVYVFALPLFGVSFYYNNVLMQNVLAFPTIAIGAFIVLPMIQRQAVLVASPEEMHGSPPRELQEHPQLRVGREVILATILWASLYFLPYLVVAPYTYYYRGSFEVFSFAYVVDAYYGNPIFTEYNLTIHGSAFPLLILPIFGILSSLRFVFIRDIYRYLKHQITYRRLLYLGILADIFPVIAYTVMQGVYPWFPYTSNVFPVPCLVVIGMLVTRLHRSVLPVANRIWDDVQARMWFEDEEEPKSVVSVFEKPKQPAEEIIKVPLTYLMVSHIRKRRHNGDSRRPEED